MNFSTPAEFDAEFGEVLFNGLDASPCDTQQPALGNDVRQRTGRPKVNADSWSGAGVKSECWSKHV